MLESAVKIISQYSTAVVSRVRFGRFEAHRVDVEDVLYLCEVDAKWFIVFETDYAMGMQTIVEDARSLFGDEFELLHWLPKLGMAAKPISLEWSDDEGAGFEGEDENEDARRYDFFEKTQYALPGSYLKFMVIEAVPKVRQRPRNDPTLYGGTSR